MFRSTPRKSLLHACRESRRRDHAFTLIELLAVIAIIAILSAILIGSISKVRNMARSSTCTSNLRQIGAAFQLYAADNHGLFPAPRMARTTTEQFTLTPDNNPLNLPPLPPGANPSGENWQIEVSRYIIRDQNAGQLKLAGSDINIAHCPCYDLLFPDLKTLSTNNSYTVGYGMNWQLNVGLTTASGSPTPIGSSTSNARTRFRVVSISNPAKNILVGDSSNYFLNSSYPSPWAVATNTDPTNSNGQPDGYTMSAPTRHGATANYLFADGHVTALSPADALVAASFHP